MKSELLEAKVLDEPERMSRTRRALAPAEKTLKKTVTPVKPTARVGKNLRVGATLEESRREAEAVPEKDTETFRQAGHSVAGLGLKLRPKDVGMVYIQIYLIPVETAAKKPAVEKKTTPAKE